MVSRTRDSSEPKSFTQVGGYRNASDTGWESSPTTTNFSYVQKKTMTDEVIPGYRRKSAKGQIFNNSMSRVFVSTFATKVADTWVAATSAPNRRYRVYGLCTVPSRAAGVYDDQRINHPSVVADRNRAKGVASTGAFAKVGTPDVDSLVSIGELRETLQFLYSPVKAMVSMVRRNERLLKTLQKDELAFAARLDAHRARLAAGKQSKAPKKGPKRSAFVNGHHVTDIPSFWLAFRYGLMPLIYEFQGYWKAFNKAAENIERVTVRDKFSTSNNIVTQKLSGPFGAGDKYVETFDLSYKVTARAGVMYQPRVETTQSQYGLELHRVPSTLWELIPLSFVYDWLGNMSDVLNALTADFRCEKVLSAWCTTKVEWLYQQSVELIPTQLGVGGTASSTESGTFTERVPISMGDISFRLRLEMNSKRVADALALVVQFLKGKK